MRYLIMLMLFTTNALAYDIDPQTGFIRGLVPEQIQRALPTDTVTTRTDGVAQLPNGYGRSANYGTGSQGYTVITNNSMYAVRTMGNTTYVTRAGRAK